MRLYRKYLYTAKILDIRGIRFIIENGGGGMNFGDFLSMVGKIASP
jgi:hypothetical protein